MEEAESILKGSSHSSDTFPDGRGNLYIIQNINSPGNNVVGQGNQHINNQAPAQDLIPLIVMLDDLIAKLKESEEREVLASDKEVLIVQTKHPKPNPNITQAILTSVLTSVTTETVKQTAPTITESIKEFISTYLNS